MSPQLHYQNFKKHLKAGGLFYAIWRGIRYLVFLIKKRRGKFTQAPEYMIMKGKMAIICSGHKIDIFWNDAEVTKGAGLKIGINTLGLWTDSAKADWRIIDKGKEHFKIKVVFAELPLNQIWTIKAEQEGQIHWEIDMEIEGELYINEFRILCMANPQYKSWVNNYRQGDFPRLNKRGHLLCLDSLSTSLVGVRFPIEKVFLPALILRPRRDREELFPVIGNTPLDINAHIIGLRKIPTEKNKDYSFGDYHLFSGKIDLFEEEFSLDNIIESLRKDEINKKIKSAAG